MFLIDRQQHLFVARFSSAIVDPDTSLIDRHSLTTIDRRHSSSVDDIFHPTLIDTSVQPSIDTEPRDMVATLILVRDERGDLHDQEGHMRNAAEIPMEIGAISTKVHSSRNPTTTTTAATIGVMETPIPEATTSYSRECWGQNRSRRNRCPKVLRKTESRSKLQKPRKGIAETDFPASSTMTRASSPGEHDRVAGRLAGELGRDTSQLARRARPCCRSAHRRPRPWHGSARPASAANSPWTIPNPVPSHNHASSSEVSVTQSSGPWIRHQCSV
ncbi:hypothetical protein F2Q69_00023263 [Brassica cretica]|uniref:Uncharacterized protein n=1 Tax=Brassica cretica TaxID=69181 RepID=A0A8S9QDW8_BRACR|nr:hypothetical protein F2Q69_00023263 [Brassica cretica]